MFWWCWLIVALAAAAVLAVAAAAAAGLYTVHKIYGRRYDGNPNVKYFAAEDFDGLRAEPVSFLSGKETLRGFIYSRELPCAGAVIFSHGFGAGHTSYTTEIDRLTKEGFKVLAFDNAGCMSSDGDRLGCFDRGVCDLVAAAEFASRDERLKYLKKAFVGHSWGGFSVMNAFPLADGVCCAVAMCGFESGSQVLAQNIFGACAPLRAVAAAAIARRSLARSGMKRGRRSSASLRNIKKPIYLLYGEKDATVRYRWNGKKILRALKENPFVKGETFPDKGHNVYLTNEAERALHETFGSIAKVAKKDRAQAAHMYKEVDYAAVTQEDDAVMRRIAAFLRENM